MKEFNLTIANNSKNKQEFTIKARTGDEAFTQALIIIQANKGKTFFNNICKFIYDSIDEKIEEIKNVPLSITEKITLSMVKVV